LTFDDGPSGDYTEPLIETLAGFGSYYGPIRATFFVQGVQVNQFQAGDDHPTTRAHREGHLVANHSYSHPQFGRLSEEEMRKEIKDTNSLLEKHKVPSPKYFRAPYGDTDGSNLTKVLEGLKMKHVGWDVDPRDWEGGSAYQIIDKVLKRVFEREEEQRRTHIVLLHDGPGGRKRIVQVVQCIVPALSAWGYKFFSIDQL
ncbi:MAG TPA: polysaccharide deacetylase family protein, partial [Thermoanaerobaculia bacterium]|nr:polysaccharide deacetylase family protein [Thermoanaerobaculia bacterium]